MQLFINNWSAVLTAPAAASAASLSVPLADAAKLTGLGAGDHYLLTLAELDGNGAEIAWEIVKVTGSASGVLTVQRAQEGTTALDWVSASSISARATKGTLEALRAGTGTAVGDDVPQALGVASPGSSEAASRQDHVHAKPTAADIGAATTAQGAKADTAVQPAALASGLAFKVDKDGTKVLSDQNYTSAEKAKLAGLEGAHFKGLHASLAALQAAHPSAAAGDYADVDSGTGADVARFIWDVSDSTWIIQSGASGSMTAAQIKTAYESNPDTNGYSDAEKAKLGAIAAGATANAADAQLRDRSTHTGTQTASTISDLAAAVRGVIMTGVTFATATAGLATDSLLVFLGKLQAQINGLATALSGKQDALVSGTNIKTVNGTSLIGSGNLVIAGGAGDGMASVVAGPGIAVDASDPANPVISAVGGVGDYSIFDAGKPGGTLQSQKKEYFNLAGSATTDIVNIASGAGYLSSVFLAFFGVDTAWVGSIIKVYYDGEVTPSISMPFERFFITQYAGVDSAMVSEFFGFNRGASDTIGMFCNLPMPYSNGIRITLTNSSATTYRVFSTAIIHAGVPNAWSRSQRLMVKDSYIPAAAPNSVNTLVDVSPGVPGRLAGIWFLEDDFPGGLSPKGAALEGNIKIYMDGALVPSYESSGTEDYFLMSFYFAGAGMNRNGGEVGTTFINRAAGTFGAWRTHIRNPYTFETALKITWQCGETVNLAFTGTARVWATIFYYTE